MAFELSRLKRGDLGQLAPRKKLLKSFRAFLEDFLRSLQAFGTEGFLFLSLPADPKSPFSVQLCPAHGNRRSRREPYRPGRAGP